LLVEDDPDSRAMLATLLEFAGLAVVTAANGMEAYNMARQHHPSLILLDLMMPVMSGEEFRNVQLASRELRRIPVVVLSAHHEAQAIARRMKAAGCVMKPVDFDVLSTLVQKLVHR
jgi:CheY-like chemotaxis protein